eukprot:2694704-Rhodomonas_salina.2
MRGSALRRASPHARVPVRRDAFSPLDQTQTQPIGGIQLPQNTSWMKQRRCASAGRTRSDIDSPGVFPMVTMMMLVIVPQS